MTKLILVANVAAAILSVSAFANTGHKTYRLPKKIVCPHIDNFGVSLDRDTFLTKFKKYAVTQSEITGGLKSVLPDDKSSGDHVWSGTTFLANGRVGFSFYGCDDSGEVDFDPASLANDEDGATKDVVANYKYEMRGDETKISVTCRAKY